MGIERFFSAINKNFDVVDSMENKPPIKCKAFLIDFNSIIHYISSKLVSEYNKKEDETDIKEISDDMIIDGIKDYLDDLLSRVNCDLIYIALDGVPTMAKILEQKKRRFIGDLIDQLASKYKSKFSFNKSLISPGTIFMKKVIDFLKNNYKTKTIISDINEKGEGEFKILEYILNKNITDFIIFSPDADLIILCMILWTQIKDAKVKILRFDQNTEVLNIIHINTLINYLSFYYEERVKNKIDIKKYIRDLSMLFTVFGNDFLPKIEEININMDLYFLLDSYIINYIDNGYLMNDDLNFVPKSFHNLLSFINRYSSTLLKRNYLSYKYQNFNYAIMVNLYMDIKNKKVNPYYKFYLDFIDNFDYDNKYGKLQYYLCDDNRIVKLLDNYKFKNNFNQKYIDKNVRYQKMIPYEFTSKNKKHLLFMKDMSLRERELYLINNKLDDYFFLFNPSTSKYDMNSDITDKKTYVHEYLKGLSWVNHYYLKSKIDETWYFKHHSSPSIKDVIDFFNPDSLNQKYSNIKLNITPLEQLLYITPLRNSNINAVIESIDANDKQKTAIINFFNENSNLFYNLDEIYNAIKDGNLKKNLMDCSKATFISKCHYYILDNIQPINQFINHSFV